MATIIYLSHNESNDAAERVRKAVDREFATNPQWNGASFSIERADSTYLDTPYPDGEVLFKSVVIPALQNETDAI